MMRRLTALLVCAVILFAMPFSVQAAFYQDGDYSSAATRYNYRFWPRDAIVVHDGVVDYYPTDDIWAGGKLYIPIYSDRDDVIATMDEIKNDKIGVSYKANRFVDGVAIVDGKDEDDSYFEPGAYACVTFTSDYPDVAASNFDLRLVITVNGVAQQITMCGLNDGFKNRVEDLHQNSAYTAQTPTVFRTDRFAGECTFDFGGDIRYTVNVKANSRYYLNLDRSEIKPVKDMYPKVYMEYYDFVGDYDDFGRAGNLEIPINLTKFKPKRGSDTQVYIYKYKDGKLTAVDKSQLSFDERRNVLTMKTPALETYVLSAQALLPDVDESAKDIIASGYAEDPVKEPPLESAPSVPSTPSTPPVSSAAPDADNPVTGGDTIRALGSRAENPATGDGMRLWPAAALLLPSAALMLLCRKKSGDAGA